MMKNVFNNLSMRKIQFLFNGFIESLFFLFKMKNHPTSSVCFCSFFSLKKLAFQFFFLVNSLKKSFINLLPSFFILIDDIISFQHVFPVSVYALLYLFSLAFLLFTGSFIFLLLSPLLLLIYNLAKTAFSIHNNFYSFQFWKYH